MLLEGAKKKRTKKSCNLEQFVSHLPLPLPTYVHDGLDAKDVGGLGQRGDVVHQVKHAGHDDGVGWILDEKGNHERNDFTGPRNNMNCDEDLAIP